MMRALDTLADSRVQNNLQICLTFLKKLAANYFETERYCSII